MVLLELLDDGRRVRRGRHRVAPSFQFAPDKLLLDQAFRSGAFRGWAEIRLLSVQKSRDADFVVQVAGSDDAIANRDRNSVDDFAVQEEDGSEQEWQNSRHRHQNVCPIEMKN